MILRVLGVCVAVMLYGVVFALAWFLHPSITVHDSPQLRDAITHISADVGQVVNQYDLQWNDPPHIVGPIDGRDKANSIITLEVRYSTQDSHSGQTTRHDLILRGVFSPKNKMIHVSKVSDRTLANPEAR